MRRLPVVALCLAAAHGRRIAAPTAAAALLEASSGSAASSAFAAASALPLGKAFAAAAAALTAQRPAAGAWGARGASQVPPGGAPMLKVAVQPMWSPGEDADAKDGDDSRRRDPVGLGGPVPASGAAGLTSVAVWIVNRLVEVALPSDWVARFVPRSIVAMGLDHAIGIMGCARLAGSPERRVVFMLRRAADPLTKRDLHIMKLVSPEGFTPTLLDSRVHDDMAYSLTDMPSGQTLASVMDFLVEHSDAEQGQTGLPPSMALPLLVDLLRALEYFERAGIVHGDLRPENIYISEADEHALIVDFRSACILGEADPDLACAPRPPSSRDAPGPTQARAATNAWQLGLVLAEMLHGAGALRGAGGRLEVGALPPLRPEAEDLTELLGGLLDPDADTRWTAGRALEAAERAAVRRLIPLPPPRKPSPPLEM